MKNEEERRKKEEGEKGKRRGFEEMREEVL